MVYTFDNVAKVIADRFKIEQALIHPNSTFDALGLDSLGQIELTLTISKTLGKKLSDDDVAELENVNDLVQLINRA